MESKVLTALILISIVALPVSGDPGFWPDAGDIVSTDELVETMTISELVAQTFMVGYTGGYPEAGFLDFITERGIGGVKIFGWNTDNLELMATGIAAMQEAAYISRTGVPLLVATDQEGGWVRHVKGTTTDTPGNLAIGASGLALDAYENGVLIGNELSVLGINMNFAPTVDVYTDPGADVIGPRAFSSDPVETAFLGLAYFRGLEKAGVVATAKHFPGHGNTNADSHGTLPVIDDDLETIWDRDLLPYRMLIAEGLPAIMSGHLSFPRITGTNEPATLSPVFLRKILRNDLGFDGIIITDDMRMYGVLQNGMGIPEACKQAILAGNDMILVSRDFETQREIFDYLSVTAAEDSLFRSRLKDAAIRIINIKRRYLLERGVSDLLPTEAEVRSGLPYAEGQSAIFDLAYRSVAIAKPWNIPLDENLHSDDGNRLLLVGQYSLFFSEGKRRFPSAQTEQTPFTRMSSAEINNLSDQISTYDHTIFCLANNAGLDILNQLEEYAHKITVFSVLTPVYLRDAPWVRSAIATFGRSRDSFRAGFAVLAGDYVPEGTLPVSLETSE